jgi:CDGSH-type Zn-finger protein
VSECQITLVPDGPALVRGADTIRDGEGRVHDVDRPVVAVCVCGLTQRPPWCDATHKVAARAVRDSA